MKKYKVSIAIKVPANFEIVVSAKDAQDALAKALEEYDNGIDGEIIPVMEAYDEAEIDTDITPESAGVYIKKIK